MKYCFILLMAAPCALLAQTTYLYDDFSDGTADGWVETATGATYEVTDSLTYRMSYAGGGDEYAFSYWGTVMPSADYTMLVEFVGHGPVSHVGFDARLIPGDMEGYAVYADYNSDDFYIAEYDPDFSILVSCDFNFKYDHHYLMKFRLQGSDLSAKIWEYGEAEPGWMIQTSDSSFPSAGYVALECMHNPSGPFSADFYYIYVASDIPVSLQESTWGGIKSAF